MNRRNRLGLGTMGMSIVRNPENSVKTIRAALDKGITLFNTGQFYNGSKSDLLEGGLYCHHALCGGLAGRVPWILCLAVFGKKKKGGCSFCCECTKDKE